MSTSYLKMFRLLPLLIVILASCSKIEDGSIKPPLVHRIDIQQGNVVDQAMINRLKVGMDKKQVRFIMGSPLLVDPFHSGRWDYLYTHQEGGGVREKRHITLYFEDEKLAFVKGDIKVTNLPIKDDETNREKSIEVPADISNKTFLERLFEDEPELPDTVTSDDTPVSGDPADDSQALVEDPPGMDEPLPDAVETDATEVDLPPAAETPETVSATTDDAGDNEEGGFFSNLWGKLSGNDNQDTPPDAEVLDPDLENK